MTFTRNLRFDLIGNYLFVTLLRNIVSVKSSKSYVSESVRYVLVIVLIRMRCAVFTPVAQRETTRSEIISLLLLLRLVFVLVQTV